MKDNSDFMILKQLRNIFSVTCKEAQDVHIKLSEKAFVKQAQVLVLANGKLAESICN
jgi:hypothetical protein